MRKADALAGRKLPESRTSKVVTLADLIDEALEFVAHHKDKRNYKSKAAIVRGAFGSSPAAELTPQELERWLRGQCKTAATSNRYKAFISLCYREGLRNGKVTINPARLVRHRKEDAGRLRFLSREEYDRLHKVIARRFPEYLAEFVVSIHTGMRLSEQYSCAWSHLCRALYLVRRITIFTFPTEAWRVAYPVAGSDCVVKQGELMTPWPPVFR